MAERASVFQVTQIGVESTSGSPVAATKILAAMSVEGGIKSEVKPFRPQGNKFNTVAALGKEWFEASLSGQPTYSEIIYPLSSVLVATSGSQLGGTTAYKWTFAPDSTGSDTHKTFTVEQGDLDGAARAHRFAYGLVTAFGIEFTRDELSLSGDMIGRALVDGITMSGSAAQVELVPILPTQVSVYLADAQASLDGASALDRVLSCSWEIADRYSPVWTLNSSGSANWAAEVETAPKMTAKLKLEADAAGLGPLTQLRSGATKFMRIKAVGDTIAAPYAYTFQLDMAGKVTEASEFSDEDGVFALEWTLEGAHDATWGKAVQVDVTNKLSAL